MMKTWVTSDLHFGHANIMKFCPDTRARFKDDVAYMNEKMVMEWNSKVAPEDTVYILGDVAFMSGSNAAKYVQRLNGKKILIEGNHDVKTLKDISFRKCFEEITNYKKMAYNGYTVVMSHFPFLEWDQMHRGALHFYGHLHGGITGHEKYRCMDVGMDATGEIVVSMDYAINRIKDNVIKTHHH
jgi:calcineurin-like phosphoesterase family protein